MILKSDRILRGVLDTWFAVTQTLVKNHLLKLILEAYNEHNNYKGTGRIGNKRKNTDHPEDSIIKIG